MVKSGIPPRELIDFFFEEVAEGIWLCKNPHCQQTKKQTRNTGYTNLKYHLATCIGREYEDHYKWWRENNKGTIDEFATHFQLVPRKPRQSSIKNEGYTKKRMRHTNGLENTSDGYIESDEIALQLFNKNPTSDLAKKYFDLKQQLFVLDAEISLADKKHRLEITNLEANLEMQTKQNKAEIIQLEAQSALDEMRTKAQLSQVEMELEIAKKRTLLQKFVKKQNTKGNSNRTPMEDETDL